MIKRTAQLLSLGFILNAAFTVHTYEAFLLFGFVMDWWFNLEPQNSASIGISGGKDNDEL